MRSANVWALWGRCPRCECWFGIQTGESGGWQCPACGEKPDRLENRAVDVHADARDLVLGPAVPTPSEYWHG